MTSGGTPGLSWPDPDTGPTPPPEYRAQEPSEPRTRKPMPPWDRVKFIFLLSGLFLILFWASVVDNPIIPIADAFNESDQPVLVDPGPDRRRGRPPAPLRHQRALGRVQRVLDQEDLRRHGAAHQQAERLEPLPDVPRPQVGDADRHRCGDPGGAHRYVGRHRPVHPADDDLVGVADGLPARLLHAADDHAVRRRCSGSCRRAASRPTSPTTSRPGSPTCGARTPWSSGSRRTCCSSRLPSRSRRRAATSPAASCSGARPAPARR